MATRPPRGGKLTARQQRFVREYLIDLNATRAYVRAGYSARTANHCATKLLVKSGVAEAIQAGKARQAERAEVTADDIVRELKLLGFLDPGDLFDFSGDSFRMRAPSAIPEAARRAVASIKVKKIWEREGDEAIPVEVVEFKLHDKIAALRELALHLPGFRAPTRVAPTDPSGEKPYETVPPEWRDELARRLDSFARRSREASVPGNAK